MRKARFEALTAAEAEPERLVPQAEPIFKMPRTA
jgi:hypothetical protein